MGARPHYLDGGGGEGSATLLHRLQYFLDREEEEEVGLTRRSASVRRSSRN